MIPFMKTPLLRIRTGFLRGKIWTETHFRIWESRASLLLQKLAITRRFGSSEVALLKMKIAIMEIPCFAQNIKVIHCTDNLIFLKNDKVLLYIKLSWCSLLCWRPIHKPQFILLSPKLASVNRLNKLKDAPKFSHLWMKYFEIQGRRCFNFSPN